ncbi:MAG: hypothetical protein RIB60_00880 [Phycisphaerales bacterium]
MAFIRYAAGTAVAIAAQTGLAGEFFLDVSGDVDFVFNSFDPPLDGIEVGDSWSVRLGYDTDIPGSGSDFFRSFKDSLCSIELTIDGQTYNDSDFAQGECDIIVTQNPCPCGALTDIILDFVLPDGSIGFNLVITDEGGDFLPLMALPTDQDDLTPLLDNIQFEFFSPNAGGSVGRALATNADFINVSVKPTPGTAGLLALAGLAAARRRR